MFAWLLRLREPSRHGGLVRLIRLPTLACLFRFVDGFLPFSVRWADAWRIVGCVDLTCLHQFRVNCGLCGLAARTAVENRATLLQSSG